MRLLRQFGVCDCHSHLYGPFSRFPLSPKRTFDPPEAPIEPLENLWRALGIDRAVLIQGSAYGDDHSALLEAIARAPKTRRGVAVLNHDVTDVRLCELHHCGIRAIRFNWISHLLGRDSHSEQQRLAQAAELLDRVSSFEWHAEVHIDIANLDIVTRLSVPSGTPVVIDHMARMNGSVADLSSQIERLLRLLDQDSFWVKLSGADRLMVNSEDLKNAVRPIRQLLQTAPQRCIWGLDWPHVNLARGRSDIELAELLLEAAGDEDTLQDVLIHNPAKIYKFDLEATSLRSSDGGNKEWNNQRQAS
jgi:2-pyrone-4,6-dicarboxylate lactonase